MRGKDTYERCDLTDTAYYARIDMYPSRSGGRMDLYILLDWDWTTTFDEQRLSHRRIAFRWIWTGLADFD